MARSRTLLTIALLLLLCLLLAYTSYRAYSLSMTHDESTTYNWFRETNIWTCFYAKACWHNANNHLLNTWGWQQTVRLLGVSEFSIRLPNLLAHLLYLFCSFFLVRAVTSRFWVGLAGFAFINFNPYLLEFFSLARGYGLVAGLCLASICCLFQFLRREQWPVLLGSYLLAALAVLANFVAFNFFASLWATTFILSLLARDGRIGFRWRRQLWMNAFPLAVTAVLALLLYRPIGFLKETGDFDKYGTSSFFSAFGTVVENGLYSIRYFSEDTVLVFSILYTVFIVMALVAAFGSYFRKPTENWRQWYLATALLFLMSCLVMTAQHYLLGSNYLENRKALIFITYSGLLFFFFLHGLTEWFRRPVLVQGLAALFFLFFSYHLIRAGNFKYSREWWYDRNTREMVLYLDTLVTPGEKPVTLGVTDIFQPTTAFYYNTLGLDSFVVPAYSSEIHTDGRYVYYYVFDHQISLLEEKYILEKPFEGGRSLLRLKDYREGKKAN